MYVGTFKLSFLLFQRPSLVYGGRELTAEAIGASRHSLLAARDPPCAVMLGSGLRGLARYLLSVAVIGAVVAGYAADLLSFDIVSIIRSENRLKP